MSNLVLFAVVVLISIYITIRAFIKFRWEYMGWNVFTITYFGGFIGWPLITTIIAGYPLVVEEIGHNIPILFHIAMIGLPVTAYLMAVAMYKREIIDSQYKKKPVGNIYKSARFFSKIAIYIMLLEIICILAIEW